MSKRRQNGGLIVIEKYTYSRANELLESSLLWSDNSICQTFITR